MAARAATPPRSTARRPGCTSRWSRSSGSAARACTGAASRPRSCSRPPRCCAPSRGAEEFGVDAGQPTLDLADDAGPQAAGRRPADQGPRVAAEGPQGHRRSPAPARSSTPTARTRARLRRHRARRRRNVILATGSSPARRSPASTFDGTRVLSSDHVLELDDVPGARRGHRRRRDRLRVRVVPRRHRQRGHGPRGAAADPHRRRPAGRADVVVRAFKKRGIKVADRRRGHRARARRRELDRARTTADDGRRSRSTSTGRRERRPPARVARASGSRTPGVEVDERGFVVGRRQHAHDASPASTRSATSSPRRSSRTSASPRRSSRSRRSSARTPLPVDYDKVPWGIYCHPEVAFCGLTEEQAKERGLRRRDVDAPLRRQRPGADHRRDRRHGEDRRRAATARSSACTSPGRGPPSCSPRATSRSTGRRRRPTSRLLIHPHPTLREVFGESALALTGRSLHG